MEKKIKVKGLFHICMIIERLWTQVTQLNKFEVLDFDFALQVHEPK
jgi:hypothetical protein